MKRIITVLMLLVSFMSVWAVSTDPNVLNIKGYKIGAEDFLHIVITDALSESLDIVEEPIDGINDYIDLSRDIERFLGDADDSFTGDKVLFSYRVAGNTTGNFKIEMNFTPLTNAADGQSQIRTKYDLGNLSYSFPDNASSTMGNYTISKTETGEGNVLSARPSSGTNELRSCWSVTPDSSSTISTWIHRGAVSMVVSNDDYRSNEKPVGEYKATVEVNLYVL